VTNKIDYFEIGSPDPAFLDPLGNRFGIWRPKTP
jgi:hypothetical protein